MPTGPNGQKRPGDVIGKAIHIVQMLTGEADDGPTVDDRKEPAAVNSNGYDWVCELEPPAADVETARPTDSAHPVGAREILLWSESQISNCPTTSA